MQAWYYYRGKLIEVLGEHPGVAGAIYRGKVRLRYHEDTEVLSAQGRSRDLCRKAIAAVLDAGEVSPSRINAEWPGRFVDCWIQDWK